MHTIIISALYEGRTRD